MAEVQRRLEALTVELEELTRLGFFSDEECTSLVKKQFAFENKINSMNKALQDFKEYIAYMIALYRIIKIRRNKVKIGDKKNYLEYRVLQRIKNLYEMAAMRFPQNIELYFEFFQICKEASFLHAINKMCNMMIKHHKNNSEVWLTAAAIYFHEKKDPSKAIKLLQQGIGILNTCSALYTECIQYEVYTVVINQKVSKSNCEIQEENVSKLDRKLQVYMKQAKKHISDYSFYTNMLTFLKKFDFLKSLQIDLIDYLMNSHADCAESWHYLATKELEGEHYDVEKLEIVNVRGNKTFTNAIGVYERGLSVISQKNRCDLWAFYINCVIEFKNNDCFDSVTNYPRLALAAFERAAGDNCLSDQFYLHYLELVRDEKKIELLQQANVKMPGSVDLWTLRMRIDKARNVREEITNTFDTARKCLGLDALPVWDVMHEYILESAGENSEEVKKFYLLGIEQGGTIAESFKPKYINWLGGTNMEECREVYNTFLEGEHFHEEMYKTMLLLEEKQVDVRKNNDSLVKLELIHESACRLFGQRNVVVWINYISFLLEYKPITTAKDAITKVALETRTKLSSEYLGEFGERYDEVLQKRKPKTLKRKRDAV